MTSKQPQQIDCSTTHRCKQMWRALAVVPGADDVRHCADCDRRVYRCVTESEFEEACADGERLPAAGPFVDREFADPIAMLMAEGDAHNTDDGDADLFRETAVVWRVPDGDELEEYRREGVEMGMTEEEMEEIYPSDPFMFMIESCLNAKELNRLRTAFVRFQVHASYVADIDQRLSESQP